MPPASSFGSCAGHRPAAADVGDEVVILALNAGEYYSLAAVGARIWEVIHEPRTVQEVVGRLLSEYDVDPERCERDLLALLQQLADVGLVEVRDEITP